MAITLPDASTANVGTANSNMADLAAAQAAFVASTTVLINNAITNGFFQVQPYLSQLITPDYVTTYFEALGYTVTPPTFWGPYNPCFVANFPEVLPPDYVTWNCRCQNCGPRRIVISWGPPAEDFFLLQDGTVLQLENGPGGLFLE